MEEVGKVSHFPITSTCFISPARYAGMHTQLSMACSPRAPLTPHPVVPGPDHINRPPPKQHTAVPRCWQLWW